MTRSGRRPTSRLAVGTSHRQFHAMKYVLFYESAPDFRSKVPLHIEAHRALWRSYAADRRLLMIGPFADEPAGDAMGVFTTRAAAEDFVRDDPFVTSGLVAKWTIREWMEALAP
jgi:uncharacterized protein